MLKFLRKYQMVLLAIGGSLLMIVFTVQSVLPSLGPSLASRKVATIGPGGSSVSNADLAEAARQLAVLEAFFPDGSDNPLLGQYRPAVLRLDPGRRAEHWYLLSRAAKDAGLVGGPTEGQVWLTTWQATVARAVTEQAAQLGQTDNPQSLFDTLQKQLGDFAAQTRQRIGGEGAADYINTALAHAAGATRLLDLYTNAPRLSRDQAVATAADADLTAVVDFVVLGPELISDLPEPSEGELAEFFERYKSFAPRDRSANPFGVGYRRPPRAKIEWLALDARAVKAVVPVDRVEVRKRWQRENPQGTDEQFATARAGVEDTVRGEAAGQLLAKADQFVRAEYLKALRDVPRSNRLYTLPATWPAGLPTPDELADRVVAHFKQTEQIDFPRPTVGRADDRWYAAGDFVAIEGVGAASFRIGNTTLSASRLPDLLALPAAERAFPVQVGVPVLDEIARHPDGSYYYLTVLDHRPQSPPDDIAEVRDALRLDWRQVTAYEQLAELAERARLAVLTQGFSAVPELVPGLSADDPRRESLRVSENVQVGRAGMAPVDPTAHFDRRAFNENFRTAVVDAARGLKASGLLVDQDAGPRTLVVPMPEARAFAVATITYVRPLTIENFRAAGDRFAQATAANRLRESAGTDPLGPFAYALLAERLKFRPLGATDPEPTPAGEKAPAPATP